MTMPQALLEKSPLLKALVKSTEQRQVTSTVRLGFQQQKVTLSLSRQEA